MGVSMCSPSTGDQVNLDEFQYDMQWDTSDEQEDTDDENEFFNLGKMGKCMSSEGMSDLETATPMIRAKTGRALSSRGFSFPEKMANWHQSSVMNREAELRAKRWCKMVTDDTVENLSHTVRIAGSIVEKGVAINNELARQGTLFSKAETDISLCKYETDQVTETLKGMRSLRSKLKKVIWKKEPKFKMDEFDSKTTPFSKVKLDLFEQNRESCSLSTCKSPSLSKDTSEDVQQNQIKAGIGELHNALDIMAIQQMKVASALDTEEERLSMFEKQLTATNEKLTRQSRMIRRIIHPS